MRDVLLVDDEPDIRTLATMSLTRVGKFEVRTARSGVEALQLVRERQPDVIILDVMMPEMDGPTTLAALRNEEASKDIPVIFMTTKVLSLEVERWRSLGAAGVIQKPFDPMTLPTEVRAIVAEWSGARG
jgi:CheY-like chemotaxis protein